MSDLGLEDRQTMSSPSKYRQGRPVLGNEAARYTKFSKAVYDDLKRKTNELTGEWCPLHSFFLRRPLF